MSPERGAATAFDPPRPILPPMGMAAGRLRQADGANGVRMVPRAQGCAWSVLLSTDAEEADVARGRKKRSTLARTLRGWSIEGECAGTCTRRVLSVEQKGQLDGRRLSGLLITCTIFSSYFFCAIFLRKPEGLVAALRSR